MIKHQLATDTCNQGHTFAFIVGNPTRCPFCLARGLDRARERQQEWAGILSNALNNRDWPRVKEVIDEIIYPHEIEL